MERCGLIVRLEREDGRVGYGEIAPLEAFATESYAEAMGYCDWMPSSQEGYFLEKIPPSLRCVRFAFEAAWRMADEETLQVAPIPVCRLRQSELLQNTVVKVKIGVGIAAQEQAGLRSCFAELPAGVRLRLDANAALSPEQAEQWLSFLQPFSEQIDFLEQPCRVGTESAMQALAERFTVPLALDESVASNEALSRVLEQGWSGLLVIKPAVMGSPGQLQQLLAPIRHRVVLSSALETAVGLWPLLHLFPDCARPAGIDTAALFTDDGLGWNICSGRLDPEAFSLDNYHRIWTLIGN